MSIIQDLWYGGICGADDCGCNNPARDTDFPAYKQLQQILTTDEQRRLLDAYVDAIHFAAMDWEEKAFAYGFRLGHDLALEIKSPEKEEKGLFL